MQQLINIDYLIVNLKGQPFGNFDDNSKFSFNDYDYGTKIFSVRKDLFYNNEKIGVYTSTPRSSIISDDLAQLQFENHLFYTKTHAELKQILSVFCEETLYSFNSINRLDIAIDKHDSNQNYNSVYNRIINGSLLISGRPKNINSHFETHKGISKLNGFTVGKRASSKLLRVYNKTLSLQITEKPYINDYYKNQNFKNQDVWRFEYQLNSTFFTDLKQQSYLSEDLKYNCNWLVFDIENLVKLLEIANQGFFELHENTGKSQINKEKKVTLFDFKHILKTISDYIPNIIKLKKKLVSSLTIKKRLAKSLFREYYSNNQDITFILALNKLLLDIDVITDKPLKNWFNSKYRYYLHEFIHKEKIKNQFETQLFHEHQTLFI